MAPARARLPPASTAGRTGGIATMEVPAHRPGRITASGGYPLSSSENYGITEANLATRREFIRLGEEEKE